ncbi:MAG: hypothetical protein DHS20C21_16340 [Gemmatimonadota bacterium]|nr:MAG: hypothetical protein DHS20C21_16340 [Gemmatimonadota bacterium]
MWRWLKMAVCAGAMAATPSFASDVQDFEWLVGSWSRSGGRIVETWQLLGDSVLQGASHVVNAETGERRQDEWILLTRLGEDTFYITKPKQNPEPVAFRLVETGDDGAVFENLEHDFPQRILYRSGESGAMTVSIEGPGDNGEVQRIDFHYERLGE